VEELALVLVQVLVLVLVPMVAMMQSLPLGPEGVKLGLDC
jgi:hypothetical protein